MNEEIKKEKLLMHACCGPCFTYIENDLRENGLKLEDGSYKKIEYTACFYNPNIHPKVEYERRKEAFKNLCEMKKVDYVILDEYNLDGYVKYVALNVGNDKKYKVRCEYCYYMRLKKVFEYAVENGYTIVSTTLTVSPYQNHELIKKVGKELEKEYGIKFMYVDYRENFRKGQNMARELGIYMQKYCGCVFSFDSGKWRY
jgi:hypothetical protein